MASKHWLESKLFWIALIVLGLSMEGVALFYQYVIEEPPCILCIHFRLLFIAAIVLSLIGLMLRSKWLARFLVSLSLLGVAGFMAERSYQLLGTEKGFVLGECSMDLGYPAWFAIDKWVPWLFQPMTSCGYTPKLLFGITMAEALSVFSVVGILFALWMVISSLKNRG